MQAKQEPSDPASSPEVTLAVEALIWEKKEDGEGTLLPWGVGAGEAQG